MGLKVVYAVKNGFMFKWSKVVKSGCMWLNVVKSGRMLLIVVLCG